MTKSAVLLLAAVSAVVLPAAYLGIAKHGPRNVFRRAVEVKTLDDFDKKERDNNAGLKLAWQIAYPFSGTSLALKFVQDATDKSMATNYGDVVDSNSGTKASTFTSDPIYPTALNGPFKYRIDKELPESGYVLTKSMCSGHCMSYEADCIPSVMAKQLVSLEDFFVSCASGTKYTAGGGGKKELVQYNPWMVHKIMLLVRDPLEIVLARYINYLEGKAEAHKYTKAGLKEWCDEIDLATSSQYMLRIYSSEGFEQVMDEHVLCHTEIMKITNFYNQALKVAAYLIEEEHLDESALHTVYFDDYETDLGGTVQGILDFLDLSIDESKRTSIAFSRTAENGEPLIDAKDEKRMMSLLQAEATDATMDLFQRYIE